MKNRSAEESFDFTASFQQTLARFEALAECSRIDYARLTAQRERIDAAEREASRLEDETSIVQVLAPQ